MARRKRRKPTDRRVNGPSSHESGDAGHYSRSFRLGFGAVIFAVVGLNLAVGVAGWVGEHRIVGYASSIYDDAFAAAAHIQNSELSFERFVAARAVPANRWGDEPAHDWLATSADELELAIEHTQAEPTRALEEAVRADIEWLRRQSSDDPSLPARLAEAEAGLGRLASAGDAKARKQIQDFSSRGDRLLLALAAARVLVAATFLIILFRMMRRMSRLANYDPLTGLLKRPLLRARLREALLRWRDGSRGFALLSLDLDRFKRVNDTLGHQTGDLLLREVAKRINGEVQPGDIVARFGGDEFVILQASLRSAEDAGELAGRLVAVLGAPYEINGQQILIGASAGIALAPENGRDVDDLLRNSDIALYQAKAAGKGRFLYFAAEMNATMQRRRVLELDLREALQKRQLEVHFQPLVHISTGKIVACEALVRWNHPTRGYIPPIDFLPLAEETGLIVPLGIFVLREACIAAASWTRQIRVAVNLSALQFGTNDLVSLVIEVLAETGLPANRLDLEITETLLMQDKETVVKTLTTLRELGVRILLDDFGTGYSSLAYLSSFPFDKIKIDRSFVRDVTRRPDAAAIIRAITGLAGTMGMTTIAEGVESVEELDWLRDQGCQEVQGFLFSEPIPSGDLELLLGMTAGPRSDFSAANKQAA